MGKFRFFARAKAAWHTQRHYDTISSRKKQLKRGAKREKI